MVAGATPIVSRPKGAIGNVLILNCYPATHTKETTSTLISYRSLDGINYFKNFTPSLKEQWLGLHLSNIHTNSNLFRRQCKLQQIMISKFSWKCNLHFCPKSLKTWACNKKIKNWPSQDKEIVTWIKVII
jgi:hypothetical protein